MATVTSVHSDVQEYYGKKLKTSNDLQTNACCTTSRKKKPRSLLNALSLVHEDVIAKSAKLNVPIYHKHLQWAILPIDIMGVG